MSFRFCCTVSAILLSSGTAILHTLGYLLHAGGHGTIPSDWVQFLNFMQMHLNP